MDASSPDVEKGSLGEFLERVGLELGSAAHAVDDLHSLIAFVRPDDLRNDVFIRKVQTIDLLQQHLEALSSFVHALSKVVPATLVVGMEAADDVKLSRLRERLISVGDSEDESDQAGDFCVF